ncbi:hypothetical protein HYDPIDRAFT_114809 [Hydnomerulius pinastri MD-312]|uniref:Uncharacterized protein n=1 Tax=Hydnomerulius pinastri MD-312 TaxID=994086 RepID=A0A0C9VVX8_9AGAM|nr:hypothetical protein HYDPIDRAFT_114809 [Hydnomerulius pinastri MD-312]
MSPLDPFRAGRLISLFFVFAFSVIGGSVGLNALIKSNQERSSIYKAAPLGAVIYVDVHNVFSTGAVITAICALLALLSVLFFIFTLWCPVRDKRFWLRVQSCILFLCSIWLFAVLVAFDYYFANKQAKVSATLDGVAVSDGLIQYIEESLGITPVYRNIHYLLLLAVLPWFALLFSVIAGVVLHLAARRACEPRRGYDATFSMSETERGEKGKATEGQA